MYIWTHLVAIELSEERLMTCKSLESGINGVTWEWSRELDLDEASHAFLLWK